MSGVPLELRPEAQADVDEALAWYHDQDHRLVARLLGELDAVFDRIREAPDQFPFVEGTVRRALLHKFPYSVYYVADADRAEVIAVIHQRRYPATWKREAPPED